MLKRLTMSVVTNLSSNEWHGTQLKPWRPTSFFLYHNWKAHYLVYFYCDEHSIFQNFFILFYFLVIIDEYMGAGNQSKSLCPIKPLVKLWALVKSILQSILPHMGLYFINLVALGFTLRYVMRWRLETLCLNPLVSYQIFGRS